MAGEVKIKLKLSKPITAHGEEMSELALRAPKTADVRKIGFPFLIHGEAVEIRAETVARYIATLADIPPSSVDQLAITDYSDAMSEVLGFFGHADIEVKKS